MRGIVIVPNHRFISEFGVAGQPHDAHSMRIWALFFDEIVVAHTDIAPGFIDSSGVPIGHFMLLAERGILRLDHRTRPTHTDDALRVTRDLVFDAQETHQPGAWAIGATDNEWDGAENHEARTLRVKLTRSLPVPNLDVPLEDLLAFRDRYKDERERLMHAIEGVYRAVKDDPDKPAAEMHGVREVVMAAREQLDLMENTGLRPWMADFVADFNWLGAGMGFASSVASNMSWPWIVGNTVAAGGAISISNMPGRINRKKLEGSAYRYLTLYHQELFAEAL